MESTMEQIGLFQPYYNINGNLSMAVLSGRDKVTIINYIGSCYEIQKGTSFFKKKLLKVAVDKTYHDFFMDFPRHRIYDSPMGREISKFLNLYKQKGDIFRPCLLELNYKENLVLDYQQVEKAIENFEQRKQLLILKRRR